MADAEYSPTRQQFKSALRQLNLTSLQERLLAIHSAAVNRILTATELANRAGYKNKATANAQYGKLGRLVGAALNAQNDFQLPVANLVEFGRNERQEITWILRKPLAEAVRRMRLSVDTSSEVYFPEEVSVEQNFIEGAVRRVTVNAYERNPRARAACISKFGYRCAVCDLLMVDVYGEVALNFIHIHHLKALAEVGCEYEVSPEEDLRPVCPNCHAILHTRNPPLSIMDLRGHIETNKRKAQGVGLKG